MVMCGLENRLLKFTLSQALINLVLSIVLAHTWGIRGVAAATLFTSASFGFFIFLPVLKKFAEVSLVGYIGYHFRGTALALSVLGGLLALVAFSLPGVGNLGFFDLVWRGCVVAVPYLLCNARLIRATWAS